MIRKKKAQFVGRWRITSMTEWGDTLDGMIFFHQGDESGFTAKKAGK